MTIPADAELHEIVHRVVAQMMNAGAAAPAVNPAPAVSALGEEISVLRGGLIAIGADHGGYALKGELIAHLQKQGYRVEDCGTYGTESVDYPDFAYAVARMVGRGEAWRGIIIDGAGIGSCMAANKVRGVRAAMCYDHATAINSREHNDANVLTLGAGLIGPNLARQIVDAWLTTDFGGGRHARRVSKIMAIERREASPSRPE